MDSAAAALVIGGARRIGRAVCLEFARRGYAVAVNARTSRHEVDETVGLIERTGGRATAAMGDATRTDEAREAVAQCVAAFGRLDALVYCAARREHAPLLDLDLDGWTAGLSSVLDGAFLTTKFAAPHLAETGGGVVLVSGASAFLGSVGPATPTAKSGLVGFARSVAKELGPTGVRINVLSPGRIEAEGDAADYLSRLQQARPDAAIPLRRAGHPEDVARLAVTMCGPDFSYVTGQVVHANGGIYMG